jgi:hypothetical protein
MLVEVPAYAYAFVNNGLLALLYDVCDGKYGLGLGVVQAGIVYYEVPVLLMGTCNGLGKCGFAGANVSGDDYCFDDGGVCLLMNWSLRWLPSLLPNQ